MGKKFEKKHHEEIEYDDAGSDPEIDGADTESGEGHSRVELVNDIEGLKNKTKKIRDEFIKTFTVRGVNPTWIDCMDVIASDSIDPNLNTDDDIKRELIFYNLTMLTAVDGITKLKAFKQKLNRPEDFFADMLKSDIQMTKVKRQIVTEQVRIKKYEEKKQKMHNIKFAKAYKNNVSKEKSDFKKKTKEGVESWKKHIKQNPNDYNKIDDFFEGKQGGPRQGNKRFNQTYGKPSKFGDDYGGGESYGNKSVAGGKFNKKKGGKFGNKSAGKFAGGKSNDKKYSNMHKSKTRRENDNKHYQKKQEKRPGKVSRMINRNKKNSNKK